MAFTANILIWKSADVEVHLSRYWNFVTYLLHHLPNLHEVIKATCLTSKMVEDACFGSPNPDSSWHGLCSSDCRPAAFQICSHLTIFRRAANQSKTWMQVVRWDCRDAILCCRFSLRNQIFSARVDPSKDLLLWWIWQLDYERKESLRSRLSVHTRI